MGKDALSRVMSMNRPAYPKFRNDVTRPVEKSEPVVNPLAIVDSSGRLKRSTSSSRLMQRAANATTTRYLLRGTNDSVRLGKVESPMSSPFPFETFIEVWSIFTLERGLGGTPRQRRSEPLAPMR